MVRDVNWEPLADFYALVCWPCMQSEGSRLRRLGTLIAIWAKLRISSWCAETLITLRDFRVRALKVDRSLLDPVMKLKADWLEIQEYLHVSQYDSLINTSRMRLADREVAQYLAGVKHLTRSWTHHLFLRLIIFADGLESPFDLCY
jgi:hypothetical protein